MGANTVEHTTIEPCPCGNGEVEICQLEEERMYGGGVCLTGVSIRCQACREGHDVSCTKFRATLTRKSDNLELANRSKAHSETCQLYKARVLEPAATALIERVRASGRTYSDWAPTASTILGVEVTAVLLRQDCGRGKWQDWAFRRIAEASDALRVELSGNTSAAALRVESDRRRAALDAFRRTMKTWSYPGNAGKSREGAEV